MELQEIFNTAVSHLRKQGKPCIEVLEESGAAEYQCRYRLDGLACVIGCLIPDDQYLSEMEGKRVGDLVAQFPSIDVARDYNSSGKKAELLEDLQRLHDTDEQKDWEKEFAILADEFDLTLPSK